MIKKIKKKKKNKNKFIGYINNFLISISLPHSNRSKYFFKKNIKYSSLKVISDPDYGLPYGRIPRIIIIWLCTEAKLKKSPIIYLGKSKNEFLKKLGLIPSGGKNGSINRIKNQINRLLNSKISIIYKKNNIYKFKNLNIINNAIFFWKKNSNFRKSNISLSKQFYENIKNNCLPIDLRIIKNIRSPLALDIYIWLTWKIKIIKKKTIITWKKLKLKFGFNYKNSDKGLYNFKIEFIKKLKYIFSYYPKINICILKTGLKIKNTHPYLLHIKKKKIKHFLKNKLK